MLKLNIGAGDVELLGWTNTDIEEFDITQQWPYKTASVDAINADCVLPHIPYPGGSQRDPFDKLMNEVARCLKAGGLFTFSSPDWRKPEEALTDVYHYRLIGPRTLYHYTHQPKNIRPLEATGCYFSLISYKVKKIDSYDMSLDSNSKLLPNFMRCGLANKGIFTYLFIDMKFWSMLSSDRIEWVMQRRANPFEENKYE